jgi:HEAT repeat protein
LKRNATSKPSFVSLIERRSKAMRSLVQREIDPLLLSGIDSVKLARAASQDLKLKPHIRAAACWALGQLADKRSVPFLAAALFHQELPVFFEAAKALALTKSKEAFAPLSAALRESKNASGRAVAAYALGLLGDSRARKQLELSVSNKLEKSDVRSHAAEARAGNPAVIGVKEDPKYRLVSGLKFVKSI